MHPRPPNYLVTITSGRRTTCCCGSGCSSCAATASLGMNDFEICDALVLKSIATFEHLVQRHRCRDVQRAVYEHMRLEPPPSQAKGTEDKQLRPMGLGPLKDIGVMTLIPC
jgi:hypothetical protein